MTRKNIFITVILLVLCFVSCKHEGLQWTLAPKLNKILEDYIIATPQDSIISVTFSRINGMNLVFISAGNRYDKRRVEKKKKKGDKLIVIYVTNDMDLKPYINKDSLSVFNGKIQGYTELSESKEYIKDNNPHTKVYRMISQDSITTRIGPTEHSFIAKDNNVIHSRETNKIINDYINTYPSVLYLLKMRIIDGRLYFVIEKSQFYEKKNLSGFFYRNNHLIALYNVNDADNTLISKDSIIPAKVIKGFRESTLGLDWMLNFPEYYVISRNTPIRFNDNFELMFKIAN